MGVTMAMSSPASALSRLDLPTLAGQHHVQAFAQDHALAALGDQAAEVGGQRVQRRAGLVFFKEVDFLFGEIQRGLDQHAQVDDAVGQVVDAGREFARQRGHGAARGGHRGRVDQVGHGLGLGQVHAVVEEGAAGELAGLGQAQALVAAGGQAAVEHAAQHGGTAVALQLQHVLAGIGMRGAEVQRDAFVEQLAVHRFERQVVRVARREVALEQFAHQSGQIRTGNAHDADAAPSWCGGDGGDGGVD